MFISEIFPNTQPRNTGNKIELSALANVPVKFKPQLQRLAQFHRIPDLEFDPASHQWLASNSDGINPFINDALHMTAPKGTALAASLPGRMRESEGTETVSPKVDAFVTNSIKHLFDQGKYSHRAIVSNIANILVSKGIDHRVAFQLAAQKLKALGADITESIDHKAAYRMALKRAETATPAEKPHYQKLVAHYKKMIDKQNLAAPT